MTISRFDAVLWAAGIVGNVLIVLVLLLRHRAREFPFFTAFIAGSLLRSAALLCARRGSEGLYFYTYWTMGLLVDVVLQSAVVYELASHVFRPLGRWTDDTREAMVWLILLSAAVAGVLTWMATSVSSLWQEAVVVRGNFFFSTLMSQLFVGMVMLSVTVGLPWRTHAARIAKALGAFALLDIAIDAFIAASGKQYGSHTLLVLDEVRKISYLTCLVYWIPALWADAPAPRDLSSESRQQLAALQGRLAMYLGTVRGGRRS